MIKFPQNNKKEGKKQLAEKQLKELVFSQQLEEGAKLPSERTLSQMLGISRNILREAIVSMADQGILEVRERQGIFFKNAKGYDVAMDSLRTLQMLPDDFIFFQFEVRMIISVPAARLAAIRRTDEDLRKLEDCLESFINCPYSTAEEQIQSAKWDSLLHHMVMEAAHNPMLSRINESIDTLVEKNNLLLHPSLSHEEGWVQHIQQQHAQIISAIKTHDAETAGSILRQHMVESIQAISEKRPDLVSQKRLLQLELLY